MALGLSSLERRREVFDLRFFIGALHGSLAIPELIVNLRVPRPGLRPFEGFYSERPGTLSPISRFIVIANKGDQLIDLFRSDGSSRTFSQWFTFFTQKFSFIFVTDPGSCLCIYFIILLLYSIFISVYCLSSLVFFITSEILFFYLFIPSVFLSPVRSCFLLIYPQCFFYHQWDLVFLFIFDHITLRFYTVPLWPHPELLDRILSGRTGGL